MRYWSGGNPSLSCILSLSSLTVLLQQTFNAIVFPFNDLTKTWKFAYFLLLEKNWSVFQSDCSTSSVSLMSVSSSSRGKSMSTRYIISRASMAFIVALSLSSPLTSVCSLGRELLRASYKGIRRRFKRTADLYIFIRHPLLCNGTLPLPVTDFKNFLRKGFATIP